jgi:CBS-domain-containing membrane protein
VPVVDDQDRLVGIVSHTDLLAMIEQAQEQGAQEQET